MPVTAQRSIDINPCVAVPRCVYQENMLFLIGKHGIIGNKCLTTGVDLASQSKFAIPLLDPATPQTSVVRSEAAPVRT